MNTTSLNKSDYIFFVIVLIGFYLLNRFSLFIWDDYYYSFIAGMSGGINGEYIPVDSFADAIKSNVYDYMHWNGRFIIHTITTYFCGVLGVDIFRITNSIIFVLLIVGLIKIIRSEFGYNKTDKYIILFLLFVCMPTPGHIFLGHIAFVTNYLWTSCAITYFIILYNKINKNESSYNTKVNVLLFITGIIVGSLQESFTIGISGALFIYYCFHIKEFKGSIAWLVIGFWIGTCIVTFAPGNFARLTEHNTNQDFTELQKYVNQFAHLILSTKLLPSYIIVSIILYFKNKEFITNFLKKNKLYLIAILLNSLIITIVYTGARQLTCIELFALILWVKLIYSYFFVFCNNKSRAINILISIILILLYIPIYRNRQLSYKDVIELQNEKPINSIIISKSLNNYINHVTNNQITWNYTSYDILVGVNSVFDINGLSLIKSNGKNKNYITTVLPTAPENIHAQFRNSSNYVYDKENNIYYIRFPKGKSIKKLYMYSKPSKLLNKMRNILFNIDYNKTDISYRTTYFKYSDYTYHVFYNFNNLKIRDFEIEYE